jgi:AcrR family transcriptional regulator
MSRWEPDARGRLEKAALELYADRGFDRTTVAEIARRAGLTERTFFRHYTDKREVLFHGQGALMELVVGALTAAPPGLAPIDAVVGALEAADGMFRDRRDGARLRQGVIAAHAELRERELIKLARLAGAMTDALHARGVAEPAASLAAEAGIAVFRTAFERWLADADDRDFAQHIRESLQALRAVTAGG